MSKRFKLPKNIHTCEVLLGFPEPLATVGLLTIAGSWSRTTGTAGMVPGHMIQHWNATEDQTDALVSAGLWMPTAPDWSGRMCFRFIDWED